MYLIIPKKKKKSPKKRKRWNDSLESSVRLVEDYSIWKDPSLEQYIKTKTFQQNIKDLKKKERLEKEKNKRVKKKKLKEIKEMQKERLKERERMWGKATRSKSVQLRNYSPNGRNGSPNRNVSLNGRQGVSRGEMIRRNVHSSLGIRRRLSPIRKPMQSHGGQSFLSFIEDNFSDVLKGSALFPEELVFGEELVKTLPKFLRFQGEISKKFSCQLRIKEFIPDVEDRLSVYLDLGHSREEIDGKIEKPQSRSELLYFLFQKIALLIKDQDVHSALGILKQDVLSLDPQHMFALKLFAYYSQRTDKIVQTLETLRQCRLYHPKSIEIRQWIAEIHLLNKNMEDAVQEYEYIVADLDEDHVFSLERLIVLYHELESYVKLKNVKKKLLMLQPLNIVDRHVFATQLLAENNGIELLSFYKSMVGHHKKNDVLLSEYCSLLEHLKTGERAYISAISQLTSVYPNNFDYKVQYYNNMLSKEKDGSSIHNILNEWYESLQMYCEQTKPNSNSSNQGQSVQNNQINGDEKNEQTKEKNGAERSETQESQFPLKSFHFSALATAYLLQDDIDMALKVYHVMMNYVPIRSNYHLFEYIDLLKYARREDLLKQLYVKLIKDPSILRNMRAMFHFSLALLFLRTDKSRDKGITMLGHLSKRFPDNLVFNDYYFYSLHQTEQYDTLLSEVNRLFLMNNHPRYAEKLATIYHYYKFDFEQAKQAYKQWISLEPDLKDARYEYAMLLIDGNLVSRASHQYERAICNVYTREDFAHCLHMKKHLEYAGLQYQKLIQSRPEEPLFYSRLGNIYFELGDFEQGLNMYETLHEITKNHYMRYIRYHMVYAGMLKLFGKFKKSEKVYTEILQHHPVYMPALSQLGSIFFRTKRYKLAKKVMKKLLQLDPNHTFAISKLAEYFLYHEKNSKLALKYLRMWRKLSPNEPTIDYHFANIYNELDKTEKALVNYLKCVRIRPDFSHAWEEIAKISEIQGDHEKSLMIRRLISILNGALSETDRKNTVDQLKDLCEQFNEDHLVS